MGIRKPREIAAAALINAERDGEYVERTLDLAVNSSGMSPDDRSLCREIAFGATRWRAALDWVIARKTENRRQIPAARILLRIGLYQLLWLDRIPDHAAIFETVEAARQLGLQKQCGFLNGVLRSSQRERDALLHELETLKHDDPATGWSHPKSLVDRWQARLAPAELQALLRWNNTPARVFARCNELVTPATALLDQWRTEGVTYDFGRWDWIPENQMFDLSIQSSVAALDSFRTGGFYVQDPSTLLAVQSLGARPGETVLDLCAAPGGKTCAVAQRMENRGRIVAYDTGKDRLALLRDNVTRLRADCVRIEPDAGRLAGMGPFDRILIDAPCSNTGVLRRRLDARWRFSLEELRALTATQSGLLDQAATLLRPGGVMVYSTCSLEPEENGEVVDEFLQRNTAFRLRSSRSLAPQTDGVDGAFVAVLAHQPLSV